MSKKNIILFCFSLLFFLMLFFLWYSNWAREVAYGENSTVSNFSGFGKKYFDYPEMFSVTDQNNASILISPSDYYHSNQVYRNMIYVPPQKELVYSVGRFLSAEYIPSTSDMYLTLDEGDGVTSKYRLVLQNSSYDGQYWPLSEIAIEVIDITKKRNSVTDLGSRYFVDWGSLVIDELVRPGDILVVLPSLIPPKISAVDRDGVPLVGKLVIRRLFDHRLLRFELLPLY